MIYITGDIHGDPLSRFNVDAFPEQKEMTKDDYIIILGDFGLIWDWQGESGHEKYCLDWLEDKPFTTLFVDGNHENYDRLNDYPTEMWNGGMVQKIRPSVIHLMRGEIFDLQGKKFLAMGGAASHDIQDGVLEPGDPLIKKWNREYSKMFRVNHRSWWKEEIPNAEERANAMRSLNMYGRNVDFILTHEAPSSDVILMDRYLFKPDEYSQWLETEIRQKVDYKKWFYGHYHIDKAINDKDICLYEQIVRIV